MTGHELLLLRHATAEDYRPGRTDADRRLTDRGIAQATALGRLLADAIAAGELPPIGRVLCSPAVRTRQTADGLRLPVDPIVVPELYQAALDTIAEEVHLLDETVGCALIVAHNPGVPGLVRELAGHEALAEIGYSYPPATAARFRLGGPWSGLEAAQLTELIMPDRGRISLR